MAKAYRAVSSAAERSIADLGLCATDFMVLEVLLHKGPLTISEIQNKVLVASGSMTAAADRLEQRHLLIRRSTAQDRRARILELTSEGRHLIELAYGKHAGDLEEVVGILSETEKSRLYALLGKLGKHAAQTAGQRRALDKQSRGEGTRQERNYVTQTS